jgi:hypothetical protein
MPVAKRPKSPLRVVNKRIAEIARAMDPEGVETWAFLCECEDPDCVATVALTQARFQTAAKHGLCWPSGIKPKAG